MDIKFVPLNKSDFVVLALLMSWRSNPDIYKYFLLQKSPLNWTEHYKFLIEAENRMDFIVYFQMRPIGHVAISGTDLEFPELSIMIGETTLWGKGIASFILAEFLAYLHERDFTKFSARISNTNYGSIKIFQKAGFTKIDNVENMLGWDLYLFDDKNGAK